MVKVIPARIENGHVVPEMPLPASADVRSVSILLDVAEPPRPARRESTLPRLLGILKDVGDPKQEYCQYLEEKYR